MTLEGHDNRAPGRHLYRLLLHAYPTRFRRRFGDSMEATFAVERAAAGPGRLAALRLWMWLLRDTLGSAVSERVDGWRASRRPQRPDLPPTPRQSLIEMIHDLLRDLKFGVRSLRMSPGFSCIALAVLSIGIGTTAVVFTLVDVLFLTPPPEVMESHQLVRLTRTDESSQSKSFSYPDYEVFRDRVRSFSGLTAYDPNGTAITVGLGGNQRVPARTWFTTASYFDVLGVQMELGRGFLPTEDRVRREGAVAVLSYPFWRDSLGSDPNAVGRELTINGNPFVVIGVAPRGFRGVNPVEAMPEMWVPVSMQPVVAGRDNDEFLVREKGRTITWLNVVGRLDDTVSIERAAADIDGVTAYLEENFGDWNDGQGTAVSRAFMFMPNERDELLSFTRLLGFVVGAVLLIVCANVAILQLARASGRQQEMGIRAALGAGHARVVRQLLTESLLIATVGALGGYAIAMTSSHAMATLVPMSFAVDFRPDLTVLVFAMAVGAVASIAFGIAPAITAARLDVVSALGSRAVLGQGGLLRSGLVVLQVAASVVLVTGATLFARSLMEAESIDPGFATSGRLFMNVDLQSHGYKPRRGLRVIDNALQRIRAVPGVENASSAVLSPFRGRWRSTFNPDGDESEDAPQVTAYMNVVGVDYFKTVDISLLEGRTFDAGDVDDSDSVLVINRAAAEAIWPGQNAIGQTLTFMKDDGVDRVIGVVANTNYGELGEDPMPIIYPTIGQYPQGRAVFVVSTAGSASQLAPQLRKAVLEVDPNLAFTRMTTVENAIDMQLGTYRLGARAIGLFGAIGTLLAAIGLYGVLSYGVSARRREIGIRMALGDTRRSTVRRVVGSGLRVTVLGLGIGLVAATGLVRYISSMLFGINAYDPLSFMAVPALLMFVAIVASGVPARRAATVDPAEALRAE